MIHKVCRLCAFSKMADDDIFLYRFPDEGEDPAEQTLPSRSRLRGTSSERYQENQELFDELFGDDEFLADSNNPFVAPLPKKKRKANKTAAALSEMLGTLVVKQYGIVEPENPEEFTKQIDSLLGTRADNWEEAEALARAHLAKDVFQESFKGAEEISKKAKSLMPKRSKQKQRKSKKKKKIERTKVLDSLEKTYKVMQEELRRLRIFHGPAIHALEEWRTEKTREIRGASPSQFENLLIQVKKMPAIGIHDRVAPTRALTKRQKLIAVLDTIFFRKEAQSFMPSDTEKFRNQVNDILGIEETTWEGARQKAEAYIDKHKPTLIDPQTIEKVDPLETFDIIPVNATFVQLRKKKQADAPVRARKKKAATKTTEKLDKQSVAQDKALLIELKTRAIETIQSFKGTQQAFLNAFGDSLQKIVNEEFRKAGEQLCT